MSSKVYLTQKIYIPANELNEETVDKLYSYQIFDETSCNKCEYKVDRLCDVCESCPSYGGTIKFWNRKQIKNKDYISLPVGNDRLLSYVYPQLKNKKIVDKRASPPYKLKGLKFIRDVFPYQEKASEKALRSSYGLICAPPRSGKTVIGVYLSTKLKLKTLILAHQYDFLEQFYETIYGDAKGVGAFTNAHEVDKFSKSAVAGIVNKVQDFDRYDICLCTYQTFSSKLGAERLKKIRNMFGLLIVDEVHKVGATEYSKVISKINARYRYGLTGTVERKDGKHKIVEMLLGGVRASVNIDRMKPTISLHRTKVDLSSLKTWIGATKHIANHKKRNEMIVDQVMRDIDENRIIIIPTTFVTHVKSLVDDINKRANRTIAIPFTGQLSKLQRRQAILDMRSKKYKVLVGIRSLIQLGLNIPSLDTLYEIMPISNPPNFEQETSRIKTPDPYKRTPLVRHFLDVGSLSRGCFRTCWLKTYTKGGFIITKELKDDVSDFLNEKKKFDNSVPYSGPRLW